MKRLISFLCVAVLMFGSGVFFPAPVRASSCDGSIHCGQVQHQYQCRGTTDSCDSGSIHACNDNPADCQLVAYCDQNLESSFGCTGGGRDTDQNACTSYDESTVCTGARCPIGVGQCIFTPDNAPPPYCGNGACNAGETSCNCPSDCPGSCGGCAGNNWYGCTSFHASVGPFSSFSDCSQNAQSCQCGSTSCGGTPSGLKAMIIFEDKNDNGVWDPPTEPRLTSGGCGNATYISGLSITVMNRGIDSAVGEICDDGGAKIRTPWNASGGSEQCTDPSGIPTMTCNNLWQYGTDPDNDYNISGSCLAQGTHNEGCNWNGLSCQSNTHFGALCDAVANRGYCTDGSPQNLRVGPLWEKIADQGDHVTTVHVPFGWRAGGSTSLTRTVTFGSDQMHPDACDSALVQFGLVRSPLSAPTNLALACGGDGTTATFTWTPVTGAASYQLRIDKQDNLTPEWYNPPPTGGDISIDIATDTRCTTTPTLVTCVLPVTAGAQYLSWWVQPIGQGETYPYISPTTTGSSFNCQARGDVYVTVQDDVDYQAMGALSCSTQSTVSPVANATLTLDGTTSLVTNASGLVRFQNVLYGPPNNPSHTITLDPNTLPPSYFMSCPPSGSLSPTVPNTPAAPARFYIQNVQDTWFQVQGGSVGAESSGLAIASRVPDGATNPYILTKDAANTPDSAGYAVTGFGGNMASTTTGISLTHLRQNETGETNVYAQSTRTSTKEGYSYFARQYQMGTSPVSDFSVLSMSDLTMADFASAPGQGRKAYYASQSVTVQTPLHITTGSYVIFVNGSLAITTTIQVDPGAFLAFIVSGNITVDPSVGNDVVGGGAAGVSDVEGVYIADGTFATGTQSPTTSDLQFVGSGVFVGWTGVNLQRDFKQTNTANGHFNNTIPPDLFIARPDILINTPIEMKKPNYLWLEVTP